MQETKLDISGAAYLWHYNALTKRVTSCSVLMTITKFDPIKASKEIGDNKSGFYLANHETKRGIYLGRDWEAAAAKALIYCPKYVKKRTPTESR